MDDICKQKGATCREPDGKCVCKDGQEPQSDKCKVCTPDMDDICKQKGATCREPDGKCVCKDGQEPQSDKCKVCTTEMEENCAQKGAACREPDGKCVCKDGQEPQSGKCKVCTTDMDESCKQKGAACREPDGKCVCKDGQEPQSGKCKVCTTEMEDSCKQKGAACREADGKCVCKDGQELQSGKCKVCTTEMEEGCAQKGATCRDSDGKCVCKDGQELQSDKCQGEKSPATEATVATSTPPSDGPKDCEEKIKECANTKKTSCKLINGTPTCVCPPSMKETENGDCFVAKTLTIRFRLTKTRQRRSATSSDEKPKCAMDRDELIREIKKSVPSVIEESIVCDGSDVTINAFAENKDKEKEIKDVFEKCKKGSQPNDCKLGEHISFEQGSAEVSETDLCQDEAYKKLAKEMGIVCQYDKETRMMCNNKTATAIGKAHVQGIPFEVCKALPCTKTTCEDENDKKHCVQGSCVCKPQYKDVKGECKSMCEVTPSVCPVGATCVHGEGDQSFYCECPPKLTGPLCTRENKPLRTAKLNIVVVGVVLASLLLLCFVVSASIISRLRKKVQGPSFSKDCERRPQRELRGYDGPYKASDPASLHRGRDHTSL